MASPALSRLAARARAHISSRIARSTAPTVDWSSSDADATSVVLLTEEALEAQRQALAAHADVSAAAGKVDVLYGGSGRTVVAGVGPTAALDAAAMSKGVHAAVGKLRTLGCATANFSAPGVRGDLLPGAMGTALLSNYQFGLLKGDTAPADGEGAEGHAKDRPLTALHFEVDEGEGAGASSNARRLAEASAGSTLLAISVVWMSDCTVIPVSTPSEPQCTVIPVTTPVHTACTSALARRCSQCSSLNVLRFPEWSGNLSAQCTRLCACAWCAGRRRLDVAREGFGQLPRRGRHAGLCRGPREG